MATPHRGTPNRPWRQYKSSRPAYRDAIPRGKTNARLQARSAAGYTIATDDCCLRGHRKGRKGDSSEGHRTDSSGSSTPHHPPVRQNNVHNGDACIRPLEHHYRILTKSLAAARPPRSRAGPGRAGPCVVCGGVIYARFPHRVDAPPWCVPGELCMNSDLISAFTVSTTTTTTSSTACEIDRGGVQRWETIIIHLDGVVLLLGAAARTPVVIQAICYRSAREAVPRRQELYSRTRR